MRPKQKLIVASLIYRMNIHGKAPRPDPVTGPLGRGPIPPVGPSPDPPDREGVPSQPARPFRSEPLGGQL
jgi:hypothetical protein